MDKYSADSCKHVRVPVGAFNMNAHFIASNPSTSFNPTSVYPRVDESAYVGPFSSIIGDVTIKENVFLAPNVSIRADEGFPFYIGAHSNLQDGVILHGLEHGRVMVDHREYSIYIGRHVSCAHGCIIHGPCLLDNHVFVGFHSIVLNAIVGAGCYLSHNVLVTGGVTLAPNRYVPTGTIVDTQEKADSLSRVPRSSREFAEEVQRVNNAFPSAYALQFGETRCSCGLSCAAGTLLGM